ncbi:MAG: hypothetical protein IKV73_06245 [Clostridia bacterium]|nr:hypothetical protein [Clostridia bacterium]
MKAKIISLLLAFSMLFPSLAHAAEALATNAELSYELEAITADSLLTAPLISANGINYLADSLRLPLTGSDGSEILWESTNEEILANSGSVKRPAKEVDEVTLTAYITDSGGNKSQKDFVFNVAPLNLDIGGINDFGSLEFYRGSDFSDDNWRDSNVFISGHVPNVNDGIAVLTRTDQRFYWNNGGESLVAYVEFVMRRKANETVVIKPMASNSTGLKQTEFIWTADNNFIYYTQSSNATVPLGDECSDKLKLGIYINDKNHTYSLWINNELVADRVQMTTQNGSGIQSVNFNNSTVGNLSFESYGFYTVRDSDESVARKDSDLLTLDSLLLAPLQDGIYLTSSLKLPTKGTNGSDISWDSSDESVIQPDGLVIFPVGQSKDVTLVATITKGDVTKTKSFDFKVASITEEEAVAQTLADLTVQSLLTAPLSEGIYLIDSLKLPQRGVGNSTITWVSSDNKYIASDGSLVRPAAQAVDVTLTAIVAKGNCTDTEEFTFTVNVFIQKLGVGKLYTEKILQYGYI